MWVFVEFSFEFYQKEKKVALLSHSETYFVGLVLNGTVFVQLHRYQLIPFAHHLSLYAG